VNKKETYPDFCHRTFLCQWDKATLNIAVLFMISAVMVQAGRESGILFSPSTYLSNLVTAFIVVVLTVGVGYARKKGII